MKNKNIGSRQPYPKYQSCEMDGLRSETFWSINEEDTNLNTPSNIAGYYLRMIESYISSFPSLSQASVKPSINKEILEDYSDPVIVVERGEVFPHNVGIMNSERVESLDRVDKDVFESLNPDANYYESKNYKEFIKMNMSVSIYAYSPAEAEKISNLIYSLLSAASYDVMNISFDFITAVNPPVMSGVSVVEKHSEVYTVNVTWMIEYIDDIILLIRKNLIKYVTITVREDDESRKTTI